MKAIKEIPVRYAETDKMGIVYHANYLLYFEDARTEFLNKLGYPYNKLEEQGYISPVVSFQCDYGTTLTYGDTAKVLVWVSKCTPVKTVYNYEVYKNDQEIGVDKPCATGSSVHCVVDGTTFKPVSMKRACPDLYQAYLDAVEPAGD